MLSVKEPIIADAIVTMVNLAPKHPVYLLEGREKDKLVVKVEEVTHGHKFRNNALVMRAVDRLNKYVLLSPSELIELNSWALRQMAETDDADDINMLQDILSQSAMAGNRWVKMEPMNLIDLQHAMDLLCDHGDKSGVREIARALNAPGGMEKLGQIVAADLFNGNHDRFNITYPLNKQAEGKNILQEVRGHLGTNATETLHLANFGNVLIARGGKGTPVGLDFFDPTSHHNDWKVPLAQTESHTGEQWGGRFLAAGEAANRVKVAERCVRDLNVLLGRRNRKLPRVSIIRLNKNAAARMAQGMNMGIENIKNKLTSHFQNRFIPVGLSDRLRVLGWSIQRSSPRASFQLN